MDAYQPSRIVRIAGWVFLALACIKAGYSLTRIITSQAPDFAYYYEAAAAPGTYTRDTTHLLPPASVVLYLPIRALPYATAQAVWVLFSFVCLVATVYLVFRRHVNGTVFGFAVTVALSYLSFPSQFTLGMGQVNFIALFLLMLAMETAALRPILAGVLFALAIGLKLELILLLPVAFIGGRIKTGVTAVAILIFLVIMSVVLFSIEAYTAYAMRLLAVGDGWKDIGIYYNQSLAGLIARLGGGMMAYAAAAGVALAVTALRLRKVREPFDAVFMRVMPLFLLAEPIAWQHHMVFLLPTYLYAWRRFVSRGTRAIIAVSVFLVSWNFAAPGFLDTMWLGRLVASHGTVGVLLLWMLMLV